MILKKTSKFHRLVNVICLSELMFNKKNISINLFFTFFAFFVLYVSTDLTVKSTTDLKKEYRRNPEITEFQDVKFYKANFDERNVELEAESLEIIDNLILNFISPSGTLFENGSEVFYSAIKGHLDQKKDVLTLVGDVVVSKEGADYASSRIQYNRKSQVISASGGVDTQYLDPKSLDLIKLHSRDLLSNTKDKTMRLTGDVKGKIIRKRIYEGHLDFSSEVMDFNYLESLVKLSKSVKIHRNNYNIDSGSAEIFLENFNKKLKYYVLYDDVKLREMITLANGKTQERRAFSEKLEGHQRTGKIILTGAPRVEQGEDIIKGYQITLRENVELVEVDDAQSSFSLKKE